MTRTLLRRALVAGAAATALLTLTACGGDERTSADSGHGATATTAAPAATGSTAPAAFNAADVAFAQHMIVHHQQAVEMATLAGTRAASPQVKELAVKIKAAQAPEIATMTGWLTQWGQPTAAPGGGGHGADHRSMPGMMSETDMRTLTAASGAAFDRQFLTMMIAHHEGAITMAREETAKGSDPQAKTLAEAIVADQQAEITTMRDLLTKV